MDFECVHDCFSLEQNVTWGVFLSLPFVLVGLFVWRRRGARDARDVLSSGPPGQDERETPSR